jgi:hypothetical protein
MRRLTSRLLVCVFSLALLGAGGPDGGDFKCDIEMARSIYGDKADLGIFFAYIFNAPAA